MDFFKNAKQSFIVALWFLIEVGIKKILPFTI